MLLATRARGAIRAHSSSRASALLAGRSPASPPSRAAACFCSSQDGVVALPRDALAAVQLEDPLGDVVEEVAVVRHARRRCRGTPAGAAPARRPTRRRGGWSARRAAAGRASAAASCTGRRGAARRRRACSAVASPGGRRMASMAISSWRSRSQALAASICVLDAVHLVEQLLELVRSSGSASLLPISSCCCSRARVAATASSTLPRTSLVGVEPRLLRHEADGEAGRQPGGAEEVLVAAGHDAQQRALAGAVAADDADLGPGVEGEPDVLEDLALAVGLGEVLDGEDVLFGHDCFVGCCRWLIQIIVGSRPISFSGEPQATADVTPWGASRTCKNGIPLRVVRSAVASGSPLNDSMRP